MRGGDREEEGSWQFFPVKESGHCATHNGTQRQQQNPNATVAGAVTCGFKVRAYPAANDKMLAPHAAYGSGNAPSRQTDRQTDSAAHALPRTTRTSQVDDDYGAPVDGIDWRLPF